LLVEPGDALGATYVRTFHLNPRAGLGVVAIEGVLQNLPLFQLLVFCGRPQERPNAIGFVGRPGGGPVVFPITAARAWDCYAELSRMAGGKKGRPEKNCRLRLAHEWLGTGVVSNSSRRVDPGSQTCGRGARGAVGKTEGAKEIRETALS